MAYHSGEKLLLAAAASFMAGALVGTLLGKENRVWVSENAGELSQWLSEITQEARKRTQEGYKDVKENIEKTVKDKASEARKEFE
ncbi:MAG: hypothetical protein WD267_02640 [Balneolales bacterium]